MFKMLDFKVKQIDIFYINNDSNEITLHVKGGTCHD